jgi:hypothetical protein
MRIINLNLLLSMLLISACYVMAPAVAHAQEPLPPAPPAKDYFPDKWEEYTSEQGRFRIRFPGKPKKEFSPVDLHFLTYSGLLEYRVSYVDEPELTGDPDNAKRYSEESKSASLLITKISGERIIKEKAVTVNGHPGYFLHVESAKAWVRTLEIVVGQRVYTIIVEGRKERTNKLGGKVDFEKVAMGFINSFKLISSSAKPNNGMQRTRNKRASHSQSPVRAADAWRWAADMIPAKSHGTMW